MFCYQCEQAAKGTGCTVQGVCGKDAETAALQDLLVHAATGIGWWADIAARAHRADDSVGAFLVRALFSTVTNVDFDPSRLEDLIREAATLKARVREMALGTRGALPAQVPDPAEWEPENTKAGLLAQAAKVGLMANPAKNPDLRSLEHLLLFGLKGVSAYADHAHLLGKKSSEIPIFLYKALAALAEGNRSADDLAALVMECGRINIATMELLSQAHREKFGTPEPTQVFLGTKKGPAIIVSGHDLLDLKELLEQTEDTGVNVYTHGEMLPAHGYPGLKRHPHLAGNYGTAWQNQAREFAAAPAAILMTTNCIQRPAQAYKDRIFTTGLVAWPGVEQIPDRRGGGHKDFSRVIAKARELGGFEETGGKTITVGFAHEAVLGVAASIIAAVKIGRIRHFFLIGGCDGAKPGRNYFTQFAELVPNDCVILTLACGKYRFNTMDAGTVEGLPRLLDVGQCNDAYSAVRIAQALADAFGCGINDLPLSVILSWYEQKAVAVLLSLLFLGVKDIRLGPSLPAFVTPGVLKVLVDKFGIRPIETPEKDIEECLKKKAR
ncbi:MAG: hydroxylamine reductase [Candidatus Aureabacteria bacterium]|nr:hydroxylamine reductase [Candidatus Auribacterota bacterium]